MPQKLRYAVFGVLATLVGMAAGHLVAALTNPAASPVLAVGSEVIDLTPTPLKEWAIAHFGTHDKTVLVGSVLLVVLLLSAVAGLLALRRFAYGAAMLVALVAIAGYLAVTRPAAGVTDGVPSLAAAVFGLASLWLLVGRRSANAVEPTVDDRRSITPDDQPSRRGVLLSAGSLAALAAAMGGAGHWISEVRSRISDIKLPLAADRAKPLPKGLEDKVPGITPFRTPTSAFYRVDTVLSVPIVDQNSWSLTIGGNVEHELEYSYDDLMNLPLIERDITLTCVSNEVGGHYVGGARWLGVPLKALLDKARVGGGVDQIFSTDVDGMTISTPYDLATDGRDAMIAIGMNGQPLPREHGFPARMVVPGLYGFISATKWISNLELTTYDAQHAYWTDRKWLTRAPIKLSSRVDTPKPLSTIKPGRTFIGGVAWAQPVGVQRVEVSIDGGGWQLARLGPSGGSSYWRQWYLPWDAKAGQHSLSSRVTNRDGELQTAARATPFPGGSSGIQKVVVSVA